MARRQPAEIAADFYGLILVKLEKLLGNLEYLANGEYTEDEHGNRTYTTLPDRQANIYLIDRVLGKPTERVEAKTDNTHTAVADQQTLDQAANLLKSLGLARALDSVLPAQPDTTSGGVPADR